MRRFVVIGAGILCCQTPCWAREAAPAAAVVTGQLADASVANGPNDRELKTSDAPQIQLLATADAKTVSMSWSYKFDRGERGVTQFTLGVSTALNDNGRGTELLGLKGFPGGTEVTLNFTHFSAAFNEIDTVRSRSMAETAQDFGRNETDSCAARWAALGERDAERLCDEGMTALRAQVAARVETTRLGIAPETEEEARATILRSRSASDIGSFLLTHTPPSSIWFLGSEFTGNQDNFKYLDQPLFRTLKSSKFGYTGSVFTGWIWPMSRASVMGSVSYGRTYDAQGAITLCQAINAIPQSQCITAPAGRPERSTSAIATLDVRKALLFESGRGATLAIAPSASIDLRNGDYSFDLPIYFAQDDKNKLIGGVRLGYLNTRKAGGGRSGDFSVGLFVGVPFSLVRQ
jgi:hypothetical protein